MKLPGLGDVVGGKYRLDSVLGRGGFATVYRGTDVVLDRPLAVKVLRPGHNGYPPSVPARFAVEARALGMLTNPHTIQMFDCGKTPDGVLFMVFELLGGEDLSDLLATKGEMTPREVSHVLCQLLESLKEAHAKGILHRDIKPANIRIFEYAGDPLRAKLMDFGIARWLGDEKSSITATGKVIGTVRYMSPEQVFGEEMTPASDIFTLGLVAHEMLTLDARPSIDFIGGHVEPILVGTPLGDVMQRMLKRDRSERYASAEQVLRDLRAPLTKTRPHQAPAAPVRSTEPSQGRATRRPRRPERSTSKLPWFAAAAFVLAAIGAWVAFGSMNEPPPPVVRAPPALAQELLVVEPDDEAATTAAQVAEVPETDGCGIEQESGTFTRTEVVGLDRVMWDIFVPDTYDPNERHALMVLFHADASSPREAMKAMSARAMAKEHGFVILAPRKGPDLVGYRSNLDIEHVRDLVRRIKSTYCIDADRIWVFGTGGGGYAVEALACEPWVGAMVSMSWRRNDETVACSPVRPVPNLHLAPTKSKYLPVEGGLSCAGYDTMISLEEHEQLWRRQNKCSDERTVWRRHGKSVCYEWACEEPFVSCHLDGGHAFKGFPRKVDVINCDGPPVDFPHTDAIWDFFERVTPTSKADTPRPDGP